jgi:transposase
VAHLPTSSPELNPDEQVWNHLKRRLGKVLLESKEHLKEEVRNTMLSIQRSLSLVLAFFELEDTRYAANPE